MNHLKLFEEFSEEDFGDLDAMLGDMRSLGFEGYSLYFVRFSGYIASRDLEGNEDSDGNIVEETTDWSYDEYEYTYAVCCKTAEEFYTLLEKDHKSGEFPFAEEDAEEFIGIEPGEMTEDEIIKSMEGRNVVDYGHWSDSDWAKELEIQKILGPYDVNVTEPMIEKYPFKPGSKMAKYAAPYMSLPEVGIFLSGGVSVMEPGYLGEIEIQIKVENFDKKVLLEEITDKDWAIEILEYTGYEPTIQRIKKQNGLGKDKLLVYCYWSGAFHMSDNPYLVRYCQSFVKEKNIGNIGFVNLGYDDIEEFVAGFLKYGEMGEEYKDEYILSRHEIEHGWVWIEYIPVDESGKEIKNEESYLTCSMDGYGYADTTFFKNREKDDGNKSIMEKYINFFANNLTEKISGATIQIEIYPELFDSASFETTNK